MERDSHRTFREIHGSRENLVSSVNDILGKALVEVVEDNAPLNLRFITPYKLSTDWSTDENCSEYTLTLLGDLPPGQEYISVSYTWAHSQEIDASTPIPDYRIKDQATPDAPFRSINCPTMVFHRAWCFARARNIPYIWIDQECIYQENAEDKQRHLQIMDRIYKKSRWTVAILSTEIPDTMLTALALSLVIYHHPKRYQKVPFQDLLADFEGIDFWPLQKDFEKNPEMIVGSVLSDRWFARAWTFQERRCASACVLLAPAGKKGDTAAQLPLHWIGNDISFSSRDMANISMFGDSATTSDGNQMLPISLWDERTPLNPSKPWMLFYAMEKCDNLVCSDRLTIFANVCSFRYKLNSTILNDAKYSYSTCMVALMTANEMIISKTNGIKRFNTSELNLDKSIAKALEEMQDSIEAD